MGVEVEVAVRTVKELAEDNTAVGLLQRPHLSQPQQDQVNKLLAQWKSIVAQDEEDLGRTSTVLYQIPTGNARPSRERYRSVPPILHQVGKGCSTGKQQPMGCLGLEEIRGLEILYRLPEFECPHVQRRLPSPSDRGGPHHVESSRVVLSTRPG